jgi:transcriptional regulator with XRE-family HTH domain
MLRRLRNRAGLTQRSLADRLGVAENTVARWERNEVRITSPMARLVTLTLRDPKARRKRGSR